MSKAFELDFSDIHEILEMEEKEKKKEIFLFEYDNVVHENVRQKILKRKLFQGIKERKLVSNRVDYDLPDNSIRTNRYTAYNFIPKNILEQFSTKANLYFLFIGIMQTIPYISISEGIPAIFLPLFVIIVATACKDYFEDRKRRKSDIEENLQKTLVWVKGDWKQTEWKNIRPGNIVKVSQNEYLPADLIILNSSDKRGISYLETKNLDGETNLKVKSVKKELGECFKSENFLINRVIFQYERPTNYLYCFNGNFTNDEGNQFPLDISNFILRGSCLKNTKYICGFVAYTGHETKIMLNSFRSKGKMTSVEKMMGKQILIIFLVQILLCLVCSFVYSSYFESCKDSFSYLAIKNEDVESSFFYNLFVRYGNWMLIFTNFVPISLLVTLQTIKIVQGLMMQKDKAMTTNNGDSAINVQSSNLNEELGQIEYLFSDKTGTLTCNKMDFKCISIKGKTYGKINNSDPKYIKNYNDFPNVTNVDFHDRGLIDVLNDKNSEEYENVKKALFFLSICHSVIVEPSNSNNSSTVYNASSPDEMALVNFAKFCGIEFRGINENNEIIINFGKYEKNYKLLYEFEFNSDRKRHSIIFEDKKKKIFLFCKGADSVIEGLLDLTESRKNQNYEKTWKDLKTFGSEGLRTLVLAEKNIDPDFFQVWRRKYEYAKTLIENRNQKMQELQEEIEKDLNLIGATAIEDKLQTDVDTTIQALRNAGIKVWVLTGDKIETAINIGFSCGLLDNRLKRFIVEEKTEVRLEEAFDNILGTMGREKNEENFALIIHGDSLLHIVIKPFLCKKMLQICKNCMSVLCCRVSPQQKQEVVTMMKNEFPTCSTMAIGDGANDVNMITAAHVGIGIQGVEGRQAARASDYSISEFRFLRRLLFFHGRECYRRNSQVVCYNFFKNICLVLPLFWYGTLNLFSGLSLYDAFIYQLYNIFYTSLPIMVYAIIDQEYNDTILVENKLNYYLQGMEKTLFNTKVFWSWFFYGSFVSLILALFGFQMLEISFVNENGLTFNFWESSTMIYTLVVLTTNIQIIIFSNTHNFLSVFCLVASIGLYPLTLLIYVNITKTEFSAWAITNTNVSYMVLFVIIALTCLPSFFLEMNKKFILRNTLRRLQEQAQIENDSEYSKQDANLSPAPNIQESKSPEINMIRIKLPENNEIFNSNINIKEDFMEGSKCSKLNFGQNVNTDKSIINNPGGIIRRNRMDRFTCTTPMGGRTPNQKSAIIVGEILKNDDSKSAMPYLGFAFSQDEGE